LLTHEALKRLLMERGNSWNTFRRSARIVLTPELELPGTPPSASLRRFPYHGSGREGLKVIRIGLILFTAWRTGWATFATNSHSQFSYL
jgi:hypothetical protein